jgi:hypothetical protein
MCDIGKNSQLVRDFMKDLETKAIILPLIDLSQRVLQKLKEISNGPTI